MVTSAAGQLAMTLTLSFDHSSNPVVPCDWGNSMRCVLDARGSEVL